MIGARRRNKPKTEAKPRWQWQPPPNGLTWEVRPYDAFYGLRYFPLTTAAPAVTNWLCARLTSSELALPLVSVLASPAPAGSS